MSAFFVSRVTIKHPEKFQQYAQLAGNSMQPFGAEVILKGVADQSLTNSLSHQLTSIVEFPDIDSLRAWAESDTYQALLALRDEAATVEITSYIVPSAE